MSFIDSKIREWYTLLMTAVQVYGVRPGTQFRAVDGDTILTVTEFITPSSHVKPWEAKVVSDSGVPAIIEVKDLLGEGYIRVVEE